MAALLPALDDLLTALAPAAPAWVLPLVFTGMTVSVSALLEKRAQLLGRPTRAAAPQPVATPREPPGEPLGELDVDTPAAATDVDLHVLLSEVMTELRDEADRGAVQMELAIPVGLILRGERAGLRPVLFGLLRNAVAHAPGGRVFAGAMRAEDCVRIIVIDDGRTAARPIDVALRKPLARLLARSGAGLVVDHRLGGGTTLVLSLPEAG